MPIANISLPTFLHANQIDALYTVYSSTQIKGFFDSQPTGIISDVNTKIVTALNSTTSGSSGAKNIGMTAISGLTGTDVQTIVESFKAYYDSSIPVAAGSINDTMLSNTVGQVKDRVATHLADSAIDIFNPIGGLVAVKGDGTDNNGDTVRLQAIINYAITNSKDVYIQKDITLVPQLQTDGTYVCLVFTDGATSGNYRRGIKFYGKQNVQITTTDAVHDHTIIRWKMADSILDGIQFKGITAKTKGLELSRIKLNDITEFDGCTRNKFTNLRFQECNYGITIEGSSYYNLFENITMITVNQGLWLKATYALINALLTNDSGVNRNNFYNISVFGSVNGIKVDLADTNKFYSCSFEAVTGNAIEVHEKTAIYPLVEDTNYNTFYGITTEGITGMCLVYDAKTGMNSFIDFETPFTKINLVNRPAYYSQSGSANSHDFGKYISQIEDQNILKYLKNRTYIETPTYVKSISDYDGVDGGGVLKGYDWRTFSFTAGQCTNVSVLTFNNAATGLPLYKSMGGIVFYILKFKFTPTNNTNDIIIPLPALTPYTPSYIYGNFPSMGVPIQYSINSATSFGTTSGILDGTGNITLKVPAGNWGAGDTNYALINIFYPRSDIVLNADAN